MLITERSVKDCEKRVTRDTILGRLIVVGPLSELDIIHEEHYYRLQQIILVLLIELWERCGNSTMEITWLIAQGHMYDIRHSDDHAMRMACYVLHIACEEPCYR